ncbi:TCP-1/cpn60 chaperonin family protein [Paenibacillus sp. y28]|uniref:TCP-1/cpn60 chaperonin family protein n=1 Tax=Paenibacillus sp. y28 TaxID=3129110 RepID=UPI003FA75441
MNANHEAEERQPTLRNNAAAVRAICSAVEGTLGPKGLDTMLVGGGGEVVITNDGVTILEMMDVTHPAARLVIQAARAQQAQVGDGTTTATVLAGALVGEGVAQVERGVPVSKVIEGIRLGVQEAAAAIARRARPLSGVEDPLLARIAWVAGREQRDIAELVIEAAHVVGFPLLASDSFRFAEAIVADEQPRSEVFPGLIVKQKPLQAYLFEAGTAVGNGIMVFEDALEPETLGEEALVTEAGLRQQLEWKAQFAAQLAKLPELGIGLIAVDRSVAPEAEQFCADHGIMVLQRALKSELRQLCEHTGARPLKRTALARPAAQLASAVGRCRELRYDARSERVYIREGAGRSRVTAIVGAGTREVAGERSRIAGDAASSVQAAVLGGIVPGGGAVELAVARELERLREGLGGLESFGVQCVAEALRRPLAQMAANGGYNPLEKLELIKAAQLAAGSDTLALDFDTGEVADMLRRGIVDPAPVKIHALEAAGEVACAILRIQTVIKMKPDAYT